ncbi:Omega-Amidase Nit2, partial [Manis pentadactyla]
SPEPCHCSAVPSADLTASKPGAKALKAASLRPPRRRRRGSWEKILTPLDRDL